jgi:hypothetical protein
VAIADRKRTRAFLRSACSTFCRSIAISDHMRCKVSSETDFSARIINSYKYAAGLQIHCPDDVLSKECARACELAHA